MIEAKANNIREGKSVFCNSYIELLLDCSRYPGLVQRVLVRLVRLLIERVALSIVESVLSHGRISETSSKRARFVEEHGGTTEGTDTGNTGCSDTSVAGSVVATLLGVGRAGRRRRRRG
jgi:hypothetical protein